MAPAAVWTNRQGGTYGRADNIAWMPSPTYLAMRAYTRARLLAARFRRRSSTWQGVRILGYHRVADERNDLSVRPAAFRDHMEQVVAADVEPVRLDTALDLLQNRVEGRYLCVTFDDGYRDNLENAVPVLEELRIPATIFVPTAIIDGTATYSWFDHPPPALSWEQISQLVRGGLVDVQAHTRSHPRLPHVSETTAREEIAGCKLDLEKRLGYEVTSFAYPAGLYTERDIRLVHEAGYRGAVTTEPGINVAGEPLHRLRRTLIYWTDRSGDFAVKLAGLLDEPPRSREWLYKRLAGR